MKKIGLISFLVIALMLAACAGGGAEQTPGALGTDAGLGTDTGLGTAAATTEATLAVTEAATEAATMAATEAATEAATTAATEVESTAEVESGIVAAPFSLFTVASVTGQTGTGGDTGTGTGSTDTGTQAAGTQPATTGTQAAGEGTQAAGTGTQTAGQNDQNRLLVRASELMGSDIVDMNGDTVGTVSDVLVDQTGNVQYIVFDASDFLGTGTGGDTGGTGTGTQPAEGTAAPVGTLDNSTAVVGTIEPAGTAGAEGTAGTGTQAAGANTPEAIATSTVGEGTAMPMPNTGVMADENTILVFNGTADSLQTQGLMLPEAALDMDGLTFDTTSGDMPATMADLNGLVRVSRVTEVNVMNGQDEELGQVEDVLVDIRQGMVAYGLVDFGGFLGIAENTVAVPWEQFTLNAEAGATADANLMLDVTEETLQNAPQLDMSSWQSWPNQIPMDWETETSTFWETAS